MTRRGYAIRVAMAAWAIGLAPISARTAAAQSSPPLRGVVYDSLAKKPLAGATVRVEGSAAFALTDGKGRFRFDSVAVGDVRLSVEHPMLDSIGLYELAARVKHDGKAEAQAAVPSFATMTRAICGRAVTGDSAMVYGTLLSPESKPAVGATVQMSWLAVRMRNKTLASQKVRYETQTDSLGRFAACALPFDEPIELFAKDAQNAEWALTLTMPAQNVRVLRQELMLSVTTDARALSTPDSTSVRRLVSGPRGIVRGEVQGTDGRPVANAVVFVGMVAETRADSGGRFELRDVPVGSHQVEAFAIGRLPQSRVANVRAGDTTRVSLALERVTALKAVRTTAAFANNLMLGLEERKRSGLGTTRDSMEIGRMPSLVASLATVPSVVARTGRGGIPIVLLPAPMGGQCEARLYIDGRPDTWERASFMLPADLAYMEVYPRPFNQPMEFQSLRSTMACGSVNFITKWRLKP